MKVILLAALFSLTIHNMMSPTSASCGKPSVQSRIFGKPTIKENPWVGTLSHIVQGEVIRCPVILIGEDRVLTSVSCVYPESNDYVVTLGNRRKRGERLDVVGIHPGNIKIPANFHTPVDGNDVAAVVLPKPVGLTNYIKPVCLPRPGYVLPIGTKMTFVRWSIGPKVQKLKSDQLKSLSNPDARQVLTDLMKDPATLQEMMDHPPFVLPTTLTEEKFKKEVLYFVEHGLSDQKFIFTYNKKGGPRIGDIGGSLIYYEKDQGKQKAVLGGIISIFLGSHQQEKSALVVSTMVSTFCQDHRSICHGDTSTLA